MPQKHPRAAERYEPVLEALRHMTAQGDRVATVRNLTLRRDVIEPYLNSISPAPCRR